MIDDASGKLEKLNKRSQKIYVEYLSDWPRQQNFIKKLQKMQVKIHKKIIIHENNYSTHALIDTLCDFLVVFLVNNFRKFPKKTQNVTIHPVVIYTRL